MASQINQNKIVNNSNSKGIKFHFASVVNDNVTIKNVPLTSAGQTSSSNYSRNWGGFDRLITIDFALMNDGTDKSTDSASKVTLKDQWEYLIESVIQGKGASASQSDVTYTITIYFADGSTKTITGSIEDISLRGSMDEANILRGTLNMFEAS